MRDDVAAGRARPAEPVAPARRSSWRGGPLSKRLPNPASPRGFAAARDWLLGGSTILRTGLLVLFIGIATALALMVWRSWRPAGRA